MKNGLESYLPENCADLISKLLDDSFTLKIVNPRKTKLGDYRAFSNKKPIITVNNDLNKFAFLTTLIHEIAHHKTYQQYKRVNPHGKEWKQVFKQLMLPFLHPSYLPNDILEPISAYIISPKATSCNDARLVEAFSKYDLVEDGIFLLKNLPENANFSLRNSRIFSKGLKRRTRYLCTELQTKRQYLVSGLASVKIVDK